jgi:hypothetical protein
MPRTPLADLPAGYDRTNYVPEDQLTFHVGDRVVWLSSLKWEDHWEVGTIVDIYDEIFDNLSEIHTLAEIEWDFCATYGEGLTSSEAVQTRESITTDHYTRKIDIMQVEEFNKINNTTLS